MNEPKISARGVVARFYQHAANHDFASAHASFSEDIEVSVYGPASLPLTGHFRGRQAAEQFYASIGKHLSVELFQPLEFIDCGSQIVVTGRERSTVKATRKTFDIDWVQIWTVSGEKIVRIRSYFDTGTMALAFAGE